VRKYQNKYEMILWALADHYLLERPYKEIYKSYLKICRTCFEAAGLPFVVPTEEDEVETEVAEGALETEDEEEIGGPQVLTKGQFSQALQYLKRDSHGAIIERPRDQRGWYRFTVPMMRGYCRIMAARQGVQIGLTYLDSHDRLVTVSRFGPSAPA